MKKYKADLSNLVPLDYILFIGVPMIETKHGAVIDLEPHALEKLAAKAVILERIPLRGKEIKFLRKTLGLSLEKFANRLGLSAGTVLHWEKADEEKLSDMNEAGVRAFLAEAFDLNIQAKFSTLVGDRLHEVKVRAS